MWLLVGNGMVYLMLNLASGRLCAQVLPALPAASCTTTWQRCAAGSRTPIRASTTRAALAYLFVMLDILLLVLSGLVLWKSVQFALLRELLGGYEAARRVHFVAMALLVGFVAVHLLMVALVPRTLIAMRARPLNRGNDTMKPMPRTRPPSMPTPSSTRRAHVASSRCAGSSCAAR